MSDVASTEFLRLIKFSFDDSSDVLRAYTKAKLIDPHYGGSFIRFLDKKKHEFYHKWQSSVACCFCGNNFNPTNPEIPTWIFNQLYEINSAIKCNQPRINGMKNRLCLCRILSKQRVSLDELDISVINHLLRLCSYSTSDTENIATQRDTLCHSWKTDKFTKAEYENIWKVLEVATLSLASEVNIYYHKSIQNVLKKSRKYDVEKEDVKKLLADIDTTLKQIHSAQTETSSMSSNEILATVSTISTELSDIKREFSNGQLSIKKEIADSAEMEKKHISYEACRIISEISSNYQDSNQVNICAGQIKESVSDATNKIELKINEECEKIHASIGETQQDRKMEINQMSRTCSSLKRKMSTVERVTKQMKKETGEIKQSVNHQEEIIGHLNQKVNKLEALVTMVLDSRLTETSQTYGTRKQITAIVDSPLWNEDETLHTLSREIKDVSEDCKSSEQTKFQIERIEKNCIQLELGADSIVFESTENLTMAVKLFIDTLVEAGKIDTSVQSTLQIKLKVTSRLTKDEKDVVYSVFARSDATERDLDKLCILNETDDNLDEKEIKENIILLPTNKSIKPEYENTTLKETFNLSIQHIHFMVKVNGIPQRELAEELLDISCYVEWIWHCPSNWEITLIVDKLKSNLSVLRDWFTLDYLYSDMQSTLILQTTTPMHVFNSRSSLEAAVQSFLEKAVDVCSLGNMEQQEVEIDIQILSSEHKSTSGQGVGTGADTKSEDVKKILDDSNVICEHCFKLFRCKNCIQKEMTIRRLTEANKIKEQALAKIEKDIPELEDKDCRSELEDRNIRKGSESECSGLESEEDTLKDTNVDNMNNSGTLVDINAARQKIHNWKTKLNLLQHQEKECRTLEFWRELNWILTMKRRKLFSDELENLNAKENMVKIIWDQLTKLKRQIKCKIRNYEGVINEETNKSDTDQDKICSVNLQSLITCSLCKTLDTTSLIAWCETCSKLVCNSCVMLHQTNTTNHKIKYDYNYLSGYMYKGQIRADQKVHAIKCVNSSALAVLHTQYFPYFAKQCTTATFSVFGFDERNKLSVIIPRYPSELDIGFIVPITDNLVVVTHEIASHMEIIDYTNGRILKQIPTHREAENINGVAFISNQLFVGFSNGIDILNMIGEKVNRIDLKDVQNLRSFGNGKLFCRHRNQTSSDIINSYIDVPNNTIYTLTNFTCNPTDITIDDEGSIIFVHTGLVCKADHSGQNSKIILTNKESHSPLQYVSWEHSSKTLCVSCSNKIYIYSKD